MSDDLWNQFERLNSSFEYSNFATALTYKNGFLNRLYDSNSNLDDERKRKIILEQRAIFFFISVFHYLSYLDKPEFVTKFKSEVEDFIKANESDLIYFQNRYIETDNRFNKIWYGYVSWFSRKSLSIFVQTLNCTLEFLQSKVESDDESADADICHTLCFSYNIVLLYSIKDSRIGLSLQKICEKIIENVKKDSSRFRYLMEPTKILVTINKNETRAHELISLLHRSANNLMSNNIESFSVPEGLLSTSIELVDALACLSVNDKSKLKSIIHEMIGELYENVAKFKIKNNEPPLVASFFYQKAYNEYNIAGNKHKYEECLRLCSENTVFGEPTVIKFDTPSINVSGNSENEIIKNLVKLFFNNQNTVLDEETNKKIVSDEINKHPLSSAVTSQNYTTIGPSSPIHGNKEKLRSEVKTAILQNINLFDFVICNNFIDLESKKKLTTTGVKDFFNSYGIFDNTSDYLVNHGLEKHFLEDYVASMHILVPQIEALLRRLLELKKSSYFKLKKDTLMFRELGGLLELDELSNILGPNLIRYLKLKYTDSNGLNLRNNLSHGILQKADFNHINSCSIIYSIMVILKASEKI